MYSAVPMLQVWPSITMVRVGFGLQLRDRVVEQTERLRTQRRTVEVEVHVLEGQLDDRRRPDHLDGDRGVRRAALAVVDGDGELHGAFLLRRRPDASGGRSGS